ncbi:MAG: phosphoglycerate kinase, partial [Lachnospiraceae bacterium]|nr:phosphoglycerate kinase [Candidatus Equihabitans merdae]
MLPYPFTIVLCGKPDLAKVRQIGALLDKADVLIVGGAIGNAMLKASGGRVGTSMTSEELEEGAA